MRLVFLGLSITSSWGNGHATTYRALLDGLARRGHDVTFLEADRPWYAAQRDLVSLPGCRIELYADLQDLERRCAGLVAEADAVVLGSFVPEGAALGRWLADRTAGIFAFYDIDTPVTLAKLRGRTCDYLAADLLPRFDIYLSFTGGPALRELEALGVGRACALYCSVDTRRYRPVEVAQRWKLGYLGTWSADRQAKLQELLVEPAMALGRERFVVAGPLYPEGMDWPVNVERLEHVAPPDHPAFYAAQEFTLNVTRADMVAAGWSPSVRLFEAAACGVPIISDRWPGLDSLFEPGREILIAESAAAVLELLRGTSPERAAAIGRAARRRVMLEHAAQARAAEFERHMQAAGMGPPARIVQAGRA